VSVSSGAPEFVRAMGPVARELLGEPNGALSSRDELRFGSRGSLSVDLTKGTFHDHEIGKGGGLLDFVQVHKRIDKDGAKAWLQERGHISAAEPGGKPRIVATYDYVNAAGELKYQVYRLDPKDFRQRRPDGHGGWIYKKAMAGVQRVLYRLPAVISAVAAGRTIFIAEGEKAVHSLESIGLVGTCSSGGAGKWRPEYSPIFRGADVVVLPDNDPQATAPDGSPRWYPDGRPVLPGQDHAADVAKHLHGIAARVRVVMLPGLPLKGDCADWIKDGGTREAMEALVDAVEARGPALEPPPPEYDDGSSDDWTAQDELPPEDKPGARKSKRRRVRAELDDDASPTDGPTIRVTAGKLHITTTAAEDALIASGLPIYQRGDGLVQPVTREVPASRGRMTLAAGLGEMTVASMIDVMCAVARWEKYDARSEEYVRINPPSLVAQILLSRLGKWRFPSIAGIITTPTLRPDGTLLTEAGYDAATRLYHVADPSLRLHSEVHAPTRKTAERALKALTDLLQEFSFVKLVRPGKPDLEVSKAVALSALITPTVRGAMSVAPLTAVNAHAPGSGKTFLIDLVSLITTGRLCPVNSAAPDEAETEKRIAGLLLAGYPIVSIDNCNGELGGDLLCQAVERPLIRIRRLGASDIIEIESTVTMFATGNNLRVRGDMVRRSLVAELDPQIERPELREFKHDPVAAILADRGRYVSACLVIVRAYILAGSPGKLTPIASFEGWSDLVRSALVWLGCADPALSMEAAREDDPELGELREVLAAWSGALGCDEGFTTKDVADKINERLPTKMGEPTDFTHPELRDSLLRLAGTQGALNTRRLSLWLLSKSGRIVAGKRFAKAGTAHGGALRWAVQTVGRK
jgi:putative DNA primase/helicase